MMNHLIHVSTFPGGVRHHPIGAAQRLQQTQKEPVGGLNETGEHARLHVQADRLRWEPTGMQGVGPNRLGDLTGTEGGRQAAIQAWASARELST